MAVPYNKRYKYTIKDLVHEFEEQGMSVSYGWVYRREKAGKLTLPRSTTNIRAVINRKKGAVRILTKDQIKEIVMAFLPLGKGKWHFKH